MPPLLADFIHNRVCELKCEKFLTLPQTADKLDAMNDTDFEARQLHFIDE